MSASPARLPDAPPRVWLVLGDKRGDNAQVEVLADALGWPCERKQLVLEPEWVQRKPRVAASLHHLDLERSSRLEPPWPDLVLTIGRRPSMAALWIREQSGGRTRIALIGKPYQVDQLARRLRGLLDAAGPDQDSEGRAGGHPS